MPIQIYTAEQVAELMGCSVKTVEAMARDGDLPGLKPGGVWIFPSGALASQLDALAFEQSRIRKAPKQNTAILRAQSEGKVGPHRRNKLPVLVDLRSPS